MLILPALIIGLLIQLLIGSLIGAVVLRAACALFNKWFGREVMSSTDQPEFQAAAHPPIKAADSPSPYAPPTTPLTQSGGSGLYVRGVPEPNFGKAFLICLLTSIANAVLGFILGLTAGFVLDGQAQDFAVLRVATFGFITLGSFFILTMAIKLGLPTSFPRSLGVTGLFLLIGLVVGILIGVVVGGVALAVSSFS